MISSTGYIQPMDGGVIGGGGVPYAAYQPLSPVSPVSPYGANASPFGISNVEYIPHRVFVGGFTSVTKEEDLHTFFQQFGNIREVKVIKSINGVSKGYGFVTFETEEEANNVRNMDPQKLQIRGRRLNLGPALRRLGAPRYSMTGYDEFTATASPYWQMGYAYAYPNSPPFFVVSPNQMVFSATAAAAAVSPPTSPTAASSVPNTIGSSNSGTPELMMAATGCGIVDGVGAPMLTAGPGGMPHY